jgi:hypothetical protein
MPRTSIGIDNNIEENVGFVLTDITSLLINIQLFFTLHSVCEAPNTKCILLHFSMKTWKTHMETVVKTRLLIITQNTHSRHVEVSVKPNM